MPQSPLDQVVLKDTSKRLIMVVGSPFDSVSSDAALSFLVGLEVTAGAEVRVRTTTRTATSTWTLKMMLKMILSRKTMRWASKSWCWTRKTSVCKRETSRKLLRPLLVPVLLPAAITVISRIIRRTIASSTASVMLIIGKICSGPIKLAAALNAFHVIAPNFSRLESDTSGISAHLWKNLAGLICPLFHSAPATDVHR